jgi:NADPH:quinone reductase-like Zn-dependent oxidoreductase
MQHEFPFMLGFDGAGRVEAVGAGRFAVGDLVHGQFAGDTFGRGTFAERVAITERPSSGALELMPEGLQPQLAAAVPIAGITADGALDKTGCRPGQARRC